MRVSRRALLEAGLAASIFPWVREAYAQTPPPPKLLLLMETSGTHQSAFWPDKQLGRSTILDPLLRNEGLRSRATIVKGLFNHEGGMGNQHDQGFAGLWTGRKSIGTFNEPWGDGPSIDQQLKTALDFSEPYPTLNTAVLASTAALFKPSRWSFSYVGSRLSIPAQIDPWKMYAAMFAPAAGGADAQVRLLQKKTVLDFVRGDLKKVKAGLPSAERAKLDVHETALRELERRLELTLVERSAACRAPGFPSERIDLSDEHNVPQLVELMFDFITLAMGCGLTRIVNFQFGQSGERWRFNWLGLDENSHDDIFHRDSGLDPVVSEKSIRIHTWVAEQVAYLGQKMLKMPGATGGSLLDESLVVWGNEMGTGPHGMDEIPIVMLGSAGGRLRPGRLVDHGPQTYHRLGCSVLNLFGVPSAGFGEMPDCGPVDGL